MTMSIGNQQRGYRKMSVLDLWDNPLQHIYKLEVIVVN